MSKFVLGTAQFGSCYGVTNSLGKVSETEVFQILKKCLASGIDTLDTAPGYGDAEQVMGRFSDIKKFKIVSKTPVLDRETDFSNGVLRKSCEESLSKLHVQRLEALLVHRGDDLLCDEGDSVIRELEDLREEKMVNKIGVSLYNPLELTQILKKFTPDIIQVPINVFDQRFCSEDIVQLCEKNNIEVHARSVFLQGLLISDINKLNKHFLKFDDFFNSYFDTLVDAGITKIEGALGFLNGNEFVNKLLIGVCSEEQLSELLGVGGNVDGVSIEFRRFATENSEIINPLSWHTFKIKPTD